MSDYWKKKREELNKSNASNTTPTDYWEKKRAELEKADDVAPVAPSKDYSPVPTLVSTRKSSAYSGGEAYAPILQQPSGKGRLSGNAYTPNIGLTTAEQIKQAEETAAQKNTTIRGKTLEEEAAEQAAASFWDSTKPNPFKADPAKTRYTTRDKQDFILSQLYNPNNVAARRDKRKAELESYTDILDKIEKNGYNQPIALYSKVNKGQFNEHAHYAGMGYDVGEVYYMNEDGTVDRVIARQLNEEEIRRIVSDFERGELKSKGVKTWEDLVNYISKQHAYDYERVEGLTVKDVVDVPTTLNTYASGGLAAPTPYAPAQQAQKSQVEQTIRQKTAEESALWDLMDMYGLEYNAAGQMVPKAKRSDYGARGRFADDGEDDPNATWFKASSLLEDGLQASDIPKIIVGTSGDLASEFGGGILEMGENIVDFGASVAGWAADSFGGKEGREWAKGVSEWVADDWYDGREIVDKQNLFSNANALLTGEDSDDVSVLGEKSDSLAQSAGQLGATMALQAVGVPWWVTTGVTSAGRGYEEAFQGGANYWEATAYAGISAGAEILSEKLFGGSGLGEKGLINLDGLTQGISSKVWKALADYGVDTAANGFEEVFTDVLTNFCSTIYKEENWLELIASEEALDGYIDSFISGSVLGGGVNVGKVGTSIKNKTDYRTGFTADEDAVFQKELEKRLEEAAKDGELSAKDKTKIRDELLKDFAEGGISTDTIDDVLGGEDYTNWKDANDSHDALQNEYNALKKEYDALDDLTPLQMTGKQSKRYKELETQLAEMEEKLKDTTERDALRQHLDDVLYGKMYGKEYGKKGEVGASVLVESYAERARRGQAFEADLTQYDEKIQPHIQKAIDSGILNNTRKTHKFVDWIAKIATDKGVSFDFTNNERLAKSGYAVQGATVNAYVEDGNIALNVDSNKSVRTVTGHEITHILEGTELYDALQNTIFDYAKTKGEYDSRLASLTELYRGKKGYETDFDAKVKKELTADLVGDYLFADGDFVSNLSVKNRNLFQKIYDEIKYLCKTVTAGSKEARELEKVKKAFEEAYRVNGKTDGTKLSMSGVNSKTANTGKLAKAESMLEQGVDPETIRKETGWFKSYDGNWRYEIDDSEFEYYPDGYSQNPDVIRAKDLNKKLKTGEATEAEFNELRKLLKNSDWEELFPQKLGNLVVHEKLFEAYPQLKDIKVSVYQLGENNGGYYDRSTKTIALNESLANNEAEAKKVLIHEIQHAIQDIEGFANGASVEYWKAQRQDIVDTISGARANLDLWLDDIGYGDFAKSSMQEVVNKEKTLEQHWEDCQEYKDNSKYAKQIAACEAELAEFQRQYDEITNGMTAYEQYRNTAGEIEARDASNRLNLTAEQRTAQRPDIDNENVVFANAKYSLSDNTGKELSKGQQDYFKDSKMRDDDGNLRVLYHGTPNQFTTFRQSKADGWGTGIYFTDNRVAAEDYGENIVEAYVNITNPYNADTMSYYDIGAEETKAYQDFDRRVWQERFDEYDTYEEYKADGMGVDMYEIYTEEVEVFNKILRELGYDGIIADGSNSIDGLEVVAFNENQPKLTTNANPTTDADIRYSMSTDSKTHIDRNALSTMRLDAPMQETVQETVQEDVAPTPKELTADDMISALWDEEFKMQGYDPNAEADASEQAAKDAFKRLRDKDAPPEVEAPYYGESRPEKAADPFLNRDWDERNTKAFITDNPDAKPFFQEAAQMLMYDYGYTMPAERGFSQELYYNSNGEKGFYGWSRMAHDDINTLMDVYGLSYAQIEDGLDAIINDTPKVNNKAAKTIEFILNQRMLKGFESYYTSEYVPPNQEYIAWLNEQQHAAEYAESIPSLMADAPISEDVAPVAPMAQSQTVEDVMPIADAPIAPQYEAIRPKQEAQPRMAKATPAEQARAQVLAEEPQAAKKKGKLWPKVKNSVLDKGMVFEDLSLKTGNRELQAKWNSIRYAEGKAQKQIGDSLKPIRDAVEKTGKTQQFFEYLYHQHNVDRMTLAERFPDMENKPVFGDTVTARESRAIIAELARNNPEFNQYAQEVYAYNTNLREMLVEGGVITRETANLWEKMYPHYVPIRRDGDTGLNINVPLDTGKTGVNAPIKRATGGSRDILPLFDTMAQRTIQTHKAISKNRFGVELKNTLGTAIESDAVGLDEAIDSIDTQDGLLQEGKNGNNPTFTVFENGKKVTFEITDEMYDAMKPTSDLLATTIKPLNKASNIFRGLTTEYNPTFIVTNPIKDVQDVLINSQHPARTYAAIPKAIKEMATNGRWYQEYVSNGGEQNTYFDKQTNAFTKEKSGLGKVLGLPLNGISKANNFIEMMPRLAEYIVSRQNGRSIDVAMLDAARVTTNFAAGGDLTKWANRNGATFLNASVQGAVQNVRNFREAKANGLKGVLTLAAKFGVAGLTATVLNGLLWDDDEDYEELSDYVKQNYYIVGKYGDGKFVRIPKGRTVAVIQDAFEQMQHLVTGDDEVDLKSFGELLLNNLAPNNPLENNIFAPIMQVANNKTWYGEDLVPTRLQDLPAEEQYDESTDSISRWLGEKLNVSPYKINYLLNQYGGGLADTFLPMLTPEAERGNNTFVGNMLAPFKDKFTTDSVMNNQNVADFYDTVDKLAVNANSSKATDRDVLKYKYINSVNAEMGELYQQKREIQNSDLPDDEKYEAVREIQQQIDELAENALNSYKGVSITGNYATVGDRQYRWHEPSEDSDAEAGWQKITDKQAAKQDEVTSELGISPSEYWGNKEEYDYAYDNPEKYKFLEESGISYETYKNADEDGKRAYTWAYENPDKIPLAKAVAGDILAYRKYTSELYDIKADKDENGKSISGSRKEKVIDYINSIPIGYGEAIILFKSEYTADDTYNRDILNYVNSRDDLTYDEKVAILEELEFEVDSDGNVRW